jgi:hypothetical protein
MRIALLIQLLTILKWECNHEELYYNQSFYVSKSVNIIWLFVKWNWALNSNRQECLMYIGIIDSHYDKQMISGGTNTIRVMTDKIKNCVSVESRYFHHVTRRKCGLAMVNAESKFHLSYTYKTLYTWRLKR